MLRKFATAVATLIVAISLAACGGTSNPTPVPTVTVTVTATPALGDSYEARYAWANSLERGELLTQIANSSSSIRSGAQRAKDNFNDVLEDEVYQNDKGEKFTCGTRFWMPESSSWTYIIPVCFDENNTLDVYESSNRIDSMNVHVIGVIDQRTVDVMVVEHEGDGVRFEYISVDNNRVCYLKECTSGDGEVSTVAENKTLEERAAKYLAQSVKELPQG